MNIAGSWKPKIFFGKPAEGIALNEKGISERSPFTSVTFVGEGHDLGW